MRWSKACWPSGCDVTDIGIVPTPVLYFSAQHLNADGAMMITGSHNPPEYNGFKTVCGSGTLHGEAIQEVRRIIESRDFERGSGRLSDRRRDRPYVDEIASQFHFDRRIKVVADAGNGTAGPVMHRIFEKLNVDVTELFFEMDGNFPNHHPDPTVPANLTASDRRGPADRRATGYRVRWRCGPHRRGGRARQRRLWRHADAHLRP